MSQMHSPAVVVCRTLSAMFATTFSRLNDEEKIVALKGFHSAMHSAPDQAQPPLAFSSGRITLSEACDEYVKGRIEGVFIRFHAKPDGGFFTVAFESSSYEYRSVELTGNGRDSVLTFGSLDDAHKALRRIGVRANKFALLTV